MYVAALCFLFVALVLGLVASRECVKKNWVEQLRGAANPVTG